MLSSSKGVLHRGALALLLTISSFGLLRCGNPANETAAALEVRVKDHRDAIDDFKSLQLTIAALRLSPDPTLKTNDPGWIELEPRVRSFDLTRYKGGDSLLIYTGAGEPQRFAAIDLTVGKTAGVLAATNASATVENHVRPIRVTFATEPGVTTTLILDLEVIDLSDHPGRGYELRVRGYELFAAGELVERVPPG